MIGPAGAPRKGKTESERGRERGNRFVPADRGGSKIGGSQKLNVPLRRTVFSEGPKESLLYDISILSRTAVNCQPCIRLRKYQWIFSIYRRN